MQPGKWPVRSVDGHGGRTVTDLPRLCKAPGSIQKVLAVGNLTGTEQHGTYRQAPAWPPHGLSCLHIAKPKSGAPCLAIRAWRHQKFFSAFSAPAAPLYRPEVPRPLPAKSRVNAVLLFSGRESSTRGATLPSAPFGLKIRLPTIVTIALPCAVWVVRRLISAAMKFHPYPPLVVRWPKTASQIAPPPECIAFCRGGRAPHP